MCSECRTIAGHYPRCPYAPEPVYETCSFCGEDMDGRYVQARDGHCSECWEEWLNDAYTAKQLTDYVKEREAEFYLHWFDRQCEALRIAIAKNEFERCEKQHNGDYTKAGYRDMANWAFEEADEFYEWYMEGNL